LAGAPIECPDAKCTIDLVGNRSTCISKVLKIAQDVMVLPAIRVGTVDYIIKRILSFDSGSYSSTNEAL
jgi:hypothetical protein